MRIAFLTPEFVTEFNYDGGLANFLNRAAFLLHEAGHDVEIFTTAAKDERIIHSELVVHRVKHTTYLYNLLKKLFRGQLSETIDVLCRSYYIKKRFMAEHGKKPFDIIQAASYLAPALFIVKSKCIPVVTRISSFGPLWRGVGSSFDNAIADWFELYQLQKSTAVYAPSHLLSEIISKFVPIPIDVIKPPFALPPSPGYDDSIYQKNLAQKKYFLFFGTLSRLKGIELIWRNLPAVFNNNDSIHFVFVGKCSLPPLTNALQMYKDRIIHLQAVPHAKLFPIVKNAVAVVLPSVIDNFPNACLESMCLGKIVVGTRGASFEEIIEDGTNGFLVNYKDDDAFVARLSQIARLPDEQRTLIGQKARETIAEKLNQGTQIEILERYFENVREKWIKIKT